ncbi:Pfs NB-ARC and TPR domain protein [Penicillium herquei]|nr:Pfs NB-ARC and TPR domain protein [Penicillium herquei]
MRPQNRSGFKIAIICALTMEADAVEALFDETYDRLGRLYGKQSGDVNAYITGRIGRHNVVLCYMPGIGTDTAAGVASSLRISYTNIELALVVGICGGAPYLSDSQQIFLGDVIISDSVVQYDFGKQYPGGFQRRTSVKDTLGRPSLEIRSLIAGLKARRSRLEFKKEMQQHLQQIQQYENDWQLPKSLDDVLFASSFAHQHRILESS